jgi:mannose-1-phosphate guanylyltransferase
MKAVIQAGGKGTRLHPYTLVLPKPLMPVGDLPVIEILLKWLRRSGICKVFVTVGHLGHLIRVLCRDGSQWSMDISYSEEPEPLGTIGPLLLLREELKETFLVLNGDLITDLDLRGFIAFHRKQKALITVATTQKSIKIDLGVLESNGTKVEAFSEKPDMKFKVSMGIYCLEPEVLEIVPSGVPFGFDDLMHTMLEREMPVHVYEHKGAWIDVGRAEDFARAQEMFRDNERSFLGT